ncbi:MAG TPA: MoxR family ATPase [Myxococcota bacterium]|jgi:MoxR-like ATPase|nr:MoxR family ATPase [Myxococcota bacterium]
MDPSQNPGHLRVAAADAHTSFCQLRSHLNEQVLGQTALIDRLLIALLADGHLLVEGAPGLAKTTAVKALAAAVEGSEQRIQFTPDLLPADLTGSEVYRPEQGSFHFQPGPIFHNLVLADEVNRAPAKVQSALLEAMAERQVTIGCETHPLPELFLVMATQNPIEQEGTYPLPEAQLDRFLLYVKIGYPDAAAERKVLRLVRDRARKLPTRAFRPIPQARVLEARSEALGVHLSEPLEEYIVQLVLATRDPSPYGEDLAGTVAWGASPRGTIALDRCSRARAWLEGRSYVTPEDVHAIAHDVLRHRVLLGYEAEARGLAPDALIDALLARVPLP